MLHVAQWARMGCYPHVSLISMLLMARWAHMLYVARWARIGCCPHVTLTLTLTTMLLMAQWTRMLHVAGGLVWDAVPV